MFAVDSLTVGEPIPDDPAAWDALVESCGPASILVAIRGRMSRALLSRTTAPDIWQDTLLNAWRLRSEVKWRGIRAFRSWLITIADHCIHDAHDRESAMKRSPEHNTNCALRARVTGANAGFRIEDIFSSATPGRCAAIAEQAAIMIRALESLEEDVREIVRLRLFEEREMKDVAMQLGINLATCKSRFRRGAEVYQRLVRNALQSRT